MLQGYNQEMSRVSIRDHSLNPNTDQLYQPLRDTFMNPQNVIKHAPLTPLATRSSFVTKDYRILSPYQLQQIQQNIYIPQGMQLEPTRNLNPIRNERFIAVDACERILGPAITPEEMERIRRQGIKKDQILYEMRQPSRPIIIEQPISTNQVESPKNKKESKAQGAFPTSPLSPPAQESQEVQERYIPQNFDTYGKNNWTYKYNLFSVIDQPVNRCRQLGIEGCGGCPGNEIVASRNRPQSLAYQ